MTEEEAAEKEVLEGAAKREELLKKEAGEKCARLLSRESDLLVLFSGDRGLVYEPDENGEHFAIRPKERKVWIPLDFFRTRKWSERRLLFHLFGTLALYPDWRRSPELYLGRLRNYHAEMEEIAGCFLRKVKAGGYEDDPAYQPQNVYLFVENDLSSFLEDFDTWTAILTVFLRAPVYDEKEVKKDIADMLLLEDFFSVEESSTGTHRALIKDILITEFYGKEMIERPEIREILEKPVFGMPRFDYLRGRLTDIILRGGGIEERDRLLRTFLMQDFLRLWKEDIGRMKLDATRQEETRDGAKTRRARKTDPSMQQADRQKMLKDLKDMKESRSLAVKQMLDGEPDLGPYGVTDADLSLFRHYEAAVRPERERMKQFWRRLIGEAAREENVRIEGTPKGILNVNTLIRSWPDFTEAEQKQNYRGLTVFDSYELRKQLKVLPRYLDISFVIDNSGSMRAGKTEAARKALAIVLLSLTDFRAYLSAAAAAVHTKIEVRTETWLFGTSPVKVMSFDDEEEKRRADLVLSIARLSGSGGSTNDGECLNEVQKSITPDLVREQAGGRRIRLIFEVTDGVSSFPGQTKKAVEELTAKHCEVRAIEIGRRDDQEAQRIFHYVFGSRGLYLGEETDRLPEALLEAVKGEVSSVFGKGK